MPFHHELHTGRSDIKLNWLRAAVLGANDGIVSVAAIISGVAGASDSTGFILTAGAAGLVAGSLSMAVGEYISVSTQRDTEKALLQKEKFELESEPEAEFEELVSLYEVKGLSKETARVVAKELTNHGAFAAHVDVELHINPDELMNPWHATLASALSFLTGGAIPLLAILFAPAPLRISVMLMAVVLALAVTGGLSAHAGGAGKLRATARVVVGGMLAMAVTYGIGTLLGHTGI